MSAFLRKGRSGVIDLVVDQNDGQVRFNRHMTNPPRSIRLAVAAPDGMNIFATVVKGTITQLGFDFSLNATTMAAGYRLHYICE
jgi:hypothetical protein